MILATELWKSLSAFKHFTYYLKMFRGLDMIKMCISSVWIVNVYILHVLRCQIMFDKWI